MKAKNYNKYKLKKGISLITLMITIIIIIILAGAIILSLSQNNIINLTKEAVFKRDVSGYKEELLLWEFKQYSNKPDSFDVKDVNKSGEEAKDEGLIPSLKPEHENKFEVKEGELVYVGGDTNEKEWSDELINSGGSQTGLPPKVDVGEVAKDNSTIDGKSPAYNNPIIPGGFKPINDGTTWPKDWNSGLVIEDESGNQFVWVPIDGVNLKYEKWCNGFESTNDGPILSGEVDENTQVNKYGGFYVARFEAGIEEIAEYEYITVSKKGAQVNDRIQRHSALESSEGMYNTPNVRSGLITGTQWDTIARWFENSGLDITDPRAWANVKDAISPANVPGYGELQVTGYSEMWKVKNIYDFGGNSEEWSHEYNNDCIIRDIGYLRNVIDIYGSSGINQRCLTGNNNYYTGLAFRVVLYII